MDRILREHALWLVGGGHVAARLAEEGFGSKLERARKAGPGSRADLSRADLRNANLGEVNLSFANLRSVSLYDADLVGAHFMGADLSFAHLNRADLRGAYLAASFLNSVDLSQADLRGARFGSADLSNAKFEPLYLPAAADIARAVGLSRMRFDSSPKALYDLRHELKLSGFSAAERQVTAAVRRSDATWWETVLFDWTCEFGANAGRPLLLGVGLWLMCSLVYWSGLHSGGRAGLYLLASGRRVNTGNEKMRALRLRYLPLAPSKGLRYVVRRSRRELHALRTATLFSMMSALNVGFREFNFGRWVRMIQPREFDIKATGWLRAVSGLQALLSLGLVALSLLSYFGRPFE